MNKKIDDILLEHKKLVIWEMIYFMFFVSLIVFIVLVIVENNKLLYAVLLVINILLFGFYGSAIKKQRMICESLKQLLYTIANKHKEALQENDHLR